MLVEARSAALAERKKSMLRKRVNKKNRIPVRRSIVTFLPFLGADRLPLQTFKTMSAGKLTNPIFQDNQPSLDLPEFAIVSPECTRSMHLALCKVLLDSAESGESYAIPRRRERSQADIWPTKEDVARGRVGMLFRSDLLTKFSIACCPNPRPLFAM